MTKPARSAGSFLRRFGAASRGNVAMIFALMLPVLVILTMGGIDISRATTVRGHLQDALDAAALAAARSPFITDAELTDVGLRSLRGNMPGYFAEGSADTATFTLDANQIVIANATVNINTLVANIILPPYGQILDDTLPVGARSDVNRASRNLEVALVLDVTGSMRGAKLESLKDAAEELVDIVVQPLQTPFYSRMAIVPYSAGVTLAPAAATTARGAPTSYHAISGAAWTTGGSKGISAITRASPGVITAAGHGLANGDFVWLSDVTGMTQVNNKAYRVVWISTDTFSLQTLSGSNWVAVNTTQNNGYGAYTGNSNDYARKCLVSDCSVVVTANGHGLANNEFVYISHVGGMTQINNDDSRNALGYQVANVTTNTYSIGVNGASWGAYTSGGRSYCGQYGCQWRVYRNPSNAIRSVETHDCVSERTGSHAYDDAAPATAKVSFNYAYTGNNCPAQTVQPLTSDKDTLTGLIDDLAVSGSTAGQIGAAWGWYAVSSNFNGLWSSNPAGVYDNLTLLKAVVIMTDGEFNTNYCSGVLAKDASYGGTNRINCNATNGDPFDQTASLCTAMRNQNITIYTVGFQMNANGRGAEVLNACATSGAAFLPSSGADLTDAFQAIGRDITRLRISR